jgi:hypothetical protein
MEGGWSDDGREVVSTERSLREDRARAETVPGGRMIPASCDTGSDGVIRSRIEKSIGASQTKVSSGSGRELTVGGDMFCKLSVSNRFEDRTRRECLPMMNFF